ncbi:het domain-containing protein [Fusarium pseudoanthophilum]|uniref:Het domain-containing protein n=1 Tax=Fusarium pseudoanthophilum TaxID=48495 RepID=A0A8H5KXQ8_9HYPO|nr:het domain-containing protein [Fusarium pseudoanthophilum]
MESGLPVGSKHQHTARETKSSQACDDTKNVSTSSSYERTSVLSPGYESGAVQNREESRKPGISEYKYDQLPNDPSRSYFRVLKVLPTKDPESVISCTLSTVVLPPLGSKKEHMCLSHRWKTGGRSHQTLIDGRTLTVQANVYQFLKLARERYSNVPIWIDTICINQEDVDEKSHQVPLMREIYHQAQVVSYLSGVNPTLETYLKAMFQGNSPQNSFDARHPATGDDVRGTLLHLMNNEYWERAWIIQELLLGGQGVVLIGQTEIPWDRLFQHTRLLCEPDNHLTSIRAEHFAQSPLATIARHRKEGSGFTPLNLPELLSQFGNVRSYDFHDRIYALLGLAKDRDRVSVAYGSTKEDFFFDNLKSICEKRGINNSMSCLCVCTHIIYAIGLERTFFAPQPQPDYNTWALRTRLRLESHPASLRHAFSSPGQPYISLEILGRDVYGLTRRPHGIDIQLYDVYKRRRWRQNFKSTTIFIHGEFKTWHAEPSFTFTEATDRSHWYCSAIFNHFGYESLVEFSEGESAGIWLSVEGSLADSQMRLYLTREAFLGLVPVAMTQNDHGMTKGRVKVQGYVRGNGSIIGYLQSPANLFWGYYPDEDGD